MGRPEDRPESKVRQDTSSERVNSYRNSPGHLMNIETPPDKAIQAYLLNAHEEREDACHARHFASLKALDP